ncbi:MAG: DUF3857 domain-containing protein, partial [Pyrinomonadaceae bacterium]|nr:DUF3857 domain-containing protein [Pyrinomonadaceae bacterium]
MLYRLFCLLLLTFICVPVMAGDDVPSWLLQDAKTAVPTYEIKNVPAVVLRKEQSLTVDNNGRVTTTTNFAVRILTREGRDEAVATAVYNTGSEKVREFNAWLIRANGQTKKYQKNQIADISLANNDVYQEARIKVLSAEKEIDVGDVFGFQTVSEENDIFNQFPCELQERLPVLQATCSVTLPSGWKTTSVTFNHENIAPASNGATSVWQVRNLLPLRPEPMSPSVSSLAPRIAINFFPTDAAKPSPTAFNNWKEVSGWLAALQDPQAAIDDGIAAKARQLTANSKTELEKIQAIGRYVQNIQYISIQTGLGKGGGYRPHKATEVFAKSYGDCKDKANLMRAMLSVLKINSYMVA